MIVDPRCEACGGSLSPEPRYTVPGLEWVCVREAGHPRGECWRAKTIFGVIDVISDPERGGFFWFVGEDWGDCTSIADGQRQANDWHRARLLPALREVK